MFAWCSVCLLSWALCVCVCNAQDTVSTEVGSLSPLRSFSLSLVVSVQSGLNLPAVMVGTQDNTEVYNTT